MTNEYKSLPLPELCEILSGGTPKTNIKEYWNGPIPWASVKDFNTGSRWFSKTEKTISQIGLDKCSSVLLEPGDLVISARGTVGVVAQCKVHSAFNQSNYGLRAKNSVSTNDYLYYALCQAKREILSDTHGGMFDTITRETLNRLLIPAPSIKVQEKVAEILGSFDELIEVNNALSKTLEDIAQTIFKSWFIDFDPVRAKMNGEKPIGMDDETAALFPDSLEESELGLIPKGWSTGKFGESSNLLMGQSPPGDSYNSDGVGLPFYQGRTDFGFRFPKRRIFCTQENRVAQAGETLISVRAPVGDINQAIEKCIIGRGVASVMHKSGSEAYSYSLLKSLSPVLSYYNGEGTVFGAINRNDFHNLLIVEPSQKVVKAYDRVCSSINDEVRTLHLCTETLIEVRDSLLPRLISGELQIPEEMLAS